MQRADGNGYGSLLGRILLATIFLLSGINKILHPQETQQYMAAYGMDVATQELYVCAILVEVGAGLSLLLGYWTRLGAFVLFFFMIPTTLVFHTNFADRMQMTMFLKNLAMTGGLLYVYIYGPGRLSLDARQWSMKTRSLFQTRDAHPFGGLSELPAARKGVLR